MFGFFVVIVVGDPFFFDLGFLVGLCVGAVEGVLVGLSVGVPVRPAEGDLV